MDDAAFDAALIGSAMMQAEALGWRRVGVVAAARDAGLDLSRVRARFPTSTVILLRLGLIADQAALASLPQPDPASGGIGSGKTRETLFDMLMRRIDVFQGYRGGVRMVLRALPLDPALSLLLALETRKSLGWMAGAAGLDLAGLPGQLRLNGLLAVWLQTLRAWDRDDGADLGATMAALDRALDRAESLGRFIGPSRSAAVATDTGPDAPFTPPLDTAPEI